MIIFIILLVLPAPFSKAYRKFWAKLFGKIGDGAKVAWDKGSARAKEWQEQRKKKQDDKTRDEDGEGGEEEG